MPLCLRKYQSVYIDHFLHIDMNSIQVIISAVVIRLSICWKKSLVLFTISISESAKTMQGLLDSKEKESVVHTIITAHTLPENGSPLQ